MKTQYLPSFLKDLKALKSTPYFESVKALVFEEISNLQKLKGYENAYRIRIGNYRIGIIYDGETVTFHRVLHRKEIYHYFP